MRARALPGSSCHGSLVAAALSLAAGCLSSDPRREDVVERDSAGIRIVESFAPEWAEAGGWRVSENPVVQIGSAAGNPDAQLYQVRTVRRLSDATILVVNAGTHEIRIYSSTGQLLRTIGREGSGPGEFRYPMNAWVTAGDSLVVVDLDRASIFDPAGEYVRSEAYGIVQPRDRFDDGSYLRVVYAAGEDGLSLGYSRPRLAIVRSSLDAAQADTLKEVAGDEVYRISPDGSYIVSYYAPFALKRRIVLHGNFIYTGDGSAFEVAQLDASGNPVRMKRRPGAAAPVTSEAIRGFEQARLQTAQNDRQRERWQHLFREWEYPSVQPLYDELVVDGPGNIWTRHFRIGIQDASQWTVFDANGRWLGEVTLPGRLVVSAIGEDFVLGVLTDELGVEYVQLYELAK